MERLRIFLAEDHAVVREGLKLLVNSQTDMLVVGEAGDGESAWRLAAELRPDVVVMDVSMPELSGTQAARRLQSIAPEVRVLALTVHEEKGYLRELLQAGVSGYVLKRAAAEDLIQAIRIVARGGVYLDPSLAERVISSYVHNSTPATAGRENTLSLREREVLCRIAQGHSNKEIAGKLNISTKTVETYKYRAMEKVGLRTRADIVRFVVGRGWLNEES